MQPGDGGWGFNLGTQAYKALWHIASFYAQANYLFNPENTNGVATFRSQPGQSVMSVTDEYLPDGHFAGNFEAEGVALSLGVRGEGAGSGHFGKSDGFWWPGEIIRWIQG